MCVGSWGGGGEGEGACKRRLREEGDIITQTEFMFSKFCAVEKLKKKTSDRLIPMIKRRDFVIEDSD